MHVGCAKRRQSFFFWDIHCKQSGSHVPPYSRRPWTGDFLNPFCVLVPIHHTSLYEYANSTPRHRTVLSSGTFWNPDHLFTSLLLFTSPPPSIGVYSCNLVHHIRVRNVKDPTIACCFNVTCKVRERGVRQKKN